MPAMRRYAYLKEPIRTDEGGAICRIMLCETAEGVYLFGYESPDAQQCSKDLLYESAEQIYEDWDGLIDEKGWTDLEDPLPGCQQDAFIPLRIKGREAGKPEWGRYETLIEGEWVGYEPGE